MLLAVYNLSMAAQLDIITCYPILKHANFANRPAYRAATHLPTVPNVNQRTNYLTICASAKLCLLPVRSTAPYAPIPQPA